MVFVDFSCDPTFGSNCGAKAVNSTRALGNAYFSDTQLDGQILFIGEPSFIVEEIKVFAAVGCRKRSPFSNLSTLVQSIRKGNALKLVSMKGIMILIIFCRIVSTSADTLVDI
jgi:hypothetical protein